MIKKTFLLILIVFGLSSCGYTPMLSQNNNFNFNIVNLELLGDKNINNFLEKNIQMTHAIKAIKFQLIQIIKKLLLRKIQREMRQI